MLEPKVVLAALLTGVLGALCNEPGVDTNIYISCLFILSFFKKKVCLSPLFGSAVCIPFLLFSDPL